VPLLCPSNQFGQRISMKLPSWMALKDTSSFTRPSSNTAASPKDQGERSFKKSLLKQQEVPEVEAMMLLVWEPPIGQIVCDENAESGLGVPSGLLLI